MGFAMSERMARVPGQSSLENSFSGEPFGSLFHDFGIHFQDEFYDAFQDR
jgi:hypothetical protein